MNKIERNDPCPCGSGKKFKKCCYLLNFPDEKDLIWREIRELQKSLTSKFLQYLVDNFEPEEIEDAWEEFHNFEEVETFDPEHPLASIFLTWLYQGWKPDEDELSIGQMMQSDSTLKMDLKLRSYLAECLKSQFKYYEVVNSVPGKHILIKEILGSENFTVHEKSGSQNLKSGDIIFAYMVSFQGINVFEALGPIPIHPRFKIEIIQNLQNVLEDEDEELKLIDLFVDLYKRIMNPIPPTFTNTDGHLLVPHKMVFEIESANRIFDSIHSLCFNETKEELLETATFDENQNLTEIEFPWLAKGNKTHKQWDNTVLGHIRIDKNTMTVNVNSKERSDLFLKTLKKLAVTGFKLKSTVIESIEQQAKNTVNNQDGGNNLMNHPEALKAMEDYFKQHWENWIDVDLPALGNQKPKDAVKTKEGRELVDALICGFERSAIDKSIPGQTLETFKTLRFRLGILK